MITTGIIRVNQIIKRNEKAQNYYNIICLNGDGWLLPGKNY